MCSNPAYPIAYKLNNIFRQNTICVLRVTWENLNSTKDVTYLINFAYGKGLRTSGHRTFGHQDNWAPINWAPDNWAPGQLGIRTTGHQNSWAPGQLGTRTIGHQNNWAPGRNWAPGHVLVPSCPGAQLSWYPVVLVPNCPVPSCSGAQLSGAQLSYIHGRYESFFFIISCIALLVELFWFVW